MIYLKIILTSIISASVLFILTKIIGYRQISEMSAFDYINSITIGSIAAETAFARGEDFFCTLEAMIIFGLIAFILSIITDKSVKIRRIIEGCPIILMDKGKIYNKALKKAHVDINEFLIACRNSGYFDLTKLDTVILETNGKMSFIPKEEYRPLTPFDQGLSPSQEKLSFTVINDGNIMEDNLKNLGFDINFLIKKLAERKIENINEIFFASLDEDGNLTVFLNNKNLRNNNI